MLPRRLVALSSFALVMTFSSCGSGAVSTGDLESEVAQQLEAEVGLAPDSVSCPDELPAEVGAEVRCTLTSGEGTIGLTLTVTSAEGSDVAFDILVDEAPEG